MDIRAVRLVSPRMVAPVEVRSGPKPAQSTARSGLGAKTAFHAIAAAKAEQSGQSEQAEQAQREPVIFFGGSRGDKVVLRHGRSGRRCCDQGRGGQSDELSSHITFSCQVIVTVEEDQSFRSI
jgi:hypothetical protein